MRIRLAASHADLHNTMKNSVEVDIPDHKALTKYLQDNYSFLNPTEKNVGINPYCYDDRIGWNTHLITVDGKAVLFSDGPLDNERANDPCYGGVSICGDYPDS